MRDFPGEVRNFPLAGGNFPWGSCNFRREVRNFLKEHLGKLEVRNFPGGWELPQGSSLGPGKLNFPTEIGTSVWKF